MQRLLYVCYALFSLMLFNAIVFLSGKAFDIHFVINESDTKLILFELRFDVIFTSFSKSFSKSLNELENDVKMTSKRSSNKINLLSLSFVITCVFPAIIVFFPLKSEFLGRNLCEYSVHFISATSTSVSW